MAQRRFARLGFLLALVAALFLAGGVAHAIPQPAGTPWVELTAQQQKVLAPLAPEWNTLEKPRRDKWLGIAKRYPSMTPEEQQRVQDRMRDWVSLTPEQRRAVRERYRNLRNAPAEQREGLKQKWDEYESLPTEEKKRLAAKNKQVKPPVFSTSGTRAVTPKSAPRISRATSATSPATPSATAQPAVATTSGTPPGSNP